jgi:hypothetical protein
LSLFSTPEVSNWRHLYPFLFLYVMHHPISSHYRIIILNKEEIYK